MALPFEQQPNESDKAFAAFAVYLGMGPQRSLTEVCKKIGKGRSLVQRWADETGWSSRVQAYAAHMAAVERETAEALVRARAVDWVKRQEEQRREEWRVRGEVVELCRELMERWKKNVKACGSLEGIARLLDLASRLGRVSSGLPTDSPGSIGEAERPVRVEVAFALNKIYGEPLPGEVVDIQEVQSPQSKVQSLPEAPCGGPP